MPSISAKEIAKHNSESSCWVVLYGEVYDVTEFLGAHPGGSRSILRLAGKDATEQFDQIHPSGTLEENISVITKLGHCEDRDHLAVRRTNGSSSATVPIDHMLNLQDFEDNARKSLNDKAWAYYFSASDDHFTKNSNRDIYKSVFLRPRIFKNVSQIDTSSSILGYSTSLPIFVAPAAMARLAHPDGEKAIARACGKEDILQMISNNASLRYEDIVANPNNSAQKFCFQLYVQNDRSKSEEMVKRVIATRSCLAIVLTLDAPWPGKRELDERVSNLDETTVSASSGLGAPSGKGKQGIGRALFMGTASDLEWVSTLNWLSQLVGSASGIKIVLKGIQTVEDAVIASNYPSVDAIYLSNHGGRALDHAQPSLLVLAEIRKYAPEVFTKVEVFIDGGIQRGTDVVKALCLGATQVGIGRAALYSLASYGDVGVQRAIEILRGEIETAMKLLGVTRLDQLGPQYINARRLEDFLYRPIDLKSML
ncbi:FMN-dependent dehydrogenase-domain-containing protein [Dipodascopsis tothii]|uniref:FMN-dependent dehydrogenase-domain-containing protein n=1 Tax=Dipodascopsis tothii TaxID=44089 RepID=UPI0034CF6FF7